MMNDRLTIAVQKSGRLNEPSLQLLTDAGLAFSNGKQQLKMSVSNFPLDIYFLRDDDIPEYVEDKVVDAGIVGENVLAEQGRRGHVIALLGFAKCRLSLAVPRSSPATSARDLEGKTIATSYPAVLRNYLQKAGISAGIREISGSVELAPGMGLADCVCDLVSSGSTLLSNGLRELEVVMNSQAVLVSGTGLGESKTDLLERLVFRIRAVQSARKNKYILLNCPDSSIGPITEVIPGMKSPTIMPLGKPGWSSLHSVVDEDSFWEKIDRLKALGAEGILVIPIEKMIA
jgi:ATP phosphoribosyltransferase